MGGYGGEKRFETGERLVKFTFVLEGKFNHRGEKSCCCGCGTAINKQHSI